MPNSNKPHETPLKRKRGGARTASRATVIAEDAQRFLSAAEDRIGAERPGGRGLALVGIGQALLAINCNLERLAYPLVEVTVASDGAGLKPVSPYCRQPGCSAVRAPAYLDCAEHAGLDTKGDPSGDPAGPRCVNRSEFWCAVHCPPERQPAAGKTVDGCRGQKPRCSEHCA